jgi:hypothetical protein
MQGPEQKLRPRHAYTGHDQRPLQVLTKKAA